jgi:hypothetical protein
LAAQRRRLRLRALLFLDHTFPGKQVIDWKNSIRPGGRIRHSHWALALPPSASHKQHGRNNWKARVFAGLLHNMFRCVSPRLSFCSIVDSLSKCDIRHLWCYSTSKIITDIVLWVLRLVLSFRNAILALVINNVSAVPEGCQDRDDDTHSFQCFSAKVILGHVAIPFS